MTTRDDCPPAPPAKLCPAGTCEACDAERATRHLEQAEEENARTAYLERWMRQQGVVRVDLDEEPLG